MLQAGIETQLTLRQLDILPQSLRYSERKWRNLFYEYRQPNIYIYIYIYIYLQI